MSNVPPVVGEVLMPYRRVFGSYAGYISAPTPVTDKVRVVTALAGVNGRATIAETSKASGSVVRRKCGIKSL